MKLLKFISLSIPSALAFLGVGCSMAPTYQRPDLPVSEVWTETEFDDQELSVPSDLNWTEFFADQHLTRLVNLALDNNRDLRVAGLNVERIEALYQIQRLALVPNLNLNAGGTRQRVPGDLNGTGTAMTSNSFSVGGQIPSYELDFFGRVTSLKDQALETYLASQEARKSYELSIVSSVVRQYFAFLAANEQLELALNAAETAEHSYDLNRQTYEAGIGSEMSLRASETQLHAFRANVAVLRSQMTQTKNALIFLVGTSLPEDLLTRVSLADFNLVVSIPVGLPSDLLRRRPDIRSAEHVLIAANAYIGAARAAFFPSIRLTTFGGTASSELSELFESGSGSWSFSPSITLPIFSGGRNKANLDIAWVSQKIEIANYEKAIQSAFREVADGLAVRKNIDEQIDAQEARITAANRRFELSKELFNMGSESYLTVILAEQELIGAKQSLVQAQLSKLTNLTSLFAALGGGWSETNS